ncbi:Clavaminate synthase-like protein [Lepidopterella palustris CBS 459.81]|uniref:Clavaminate synthase-like protein n=1 Tax=Lepidopterella palustris CBS 459.81 TaxID=1314670 RepID=A0A8E2EFL7_9PEZI|nr:Clavaminate synthase-like protein [Lepidopterella palustris CBS 459.81]
MALPAPLQFKPLHPTFVAEVKGMDWTKPIPDSTIEQIKDGMDKYGVLVFRNANIDNDTQVAFTRRFGELDSMPFIRRRGRFPEQPHIFDVSNMDDNGEIVKTTNRAQVMLAKGNELWHADMQYHPRRDKYSVLRAVAIPPKGCGGETEFADSRTAYDELSQEWKDKLENMVCDCSLIHNRRGAAPDLYKGVDPYDWSISRWKAVYPHEGSGRKNLYVTSYCYKFDGLSIEESQKMVQELIEHGSQPKNVYRVLWEQAGDIVMWDNTATWHRALDSSAYRFKYKRDMRRTNTFDDGPNAWGENEPGNDWKVKLPKEPLAHEMGTQDAAPVMTAKEVHASA